jgi:hypothetical protein
MHIAVIADIHGNMPALEQCSPTSSVPTSTARSTSVIAYPALLGLARPAIG